MTTDNETKKEGEGNTPPPKKYAGKFDSVEELETGYKNSAKIFDENTQLKSRVEELTKVPETYLAPKDLEIDPNRLPELQARAREAGMTQTQYEKFLHSDKARVESHKSNFETAKKALGDEKINLLTDYAKKNYPAELVDTMVKTFIQDETARNAALAHREALLKNQVPGMNKTPATGYTITQEDVDKAYKAKEANPANMKARTHYLNLIKQQTAQN